MRFSIMSELVTVEKLSKLIPSRKGAITQEIANVINESTNDPVFQGDSLLNSLVTYENIMVKNKSSMGEFIRAIKFCAYVVSMNDNYTEAYKKTFNDRDFVINRMGLPTDSQGYTDLTSAASRYRKSKIVVDILTLSQVPLDLLYTGARYRAVHVLADRMENARLDRDRIAAADMLLKHTAPKDFKIALDIGVKQDDTITNLMEQLSVVAAKQRTMLTEGITDLGVLGAMKVKTNSVDVDYEVIEDE